MRLVKEISRRELVLSLVDTKENFKIQRDLSKIYKGHRSMRLYKEICRRELVLTTCNQSGCSRGPSRLWPENYWH